jgi:addiction module RelB/DinJ family antitoxin
MTTTLRIDDNLKRQCDEVFSELGLTMTSALTVFLKQVVRTRTIPFVIGRQSIAEYDVPLNAWARFDDRETIQSQAKSAWSQMRAQAQEQFKDRPEPTMDEINEMIAEVRRERRSKKQLVKAVNT